MKEKKSEFLIRIKVYTERNSIGEKKYTMFLEENNSTTWAEIKRSEHVGCVENHHVVSNQYSYFGI